MYRKFALLTCVAACALSGCSIERADPKDGYSTEYPVTALEYNLFISKEIGVVENQLITRIMAADKLFTGGIPDFPTEKEAAEESVNKVAEIRDEIIVTMPAKEYESDRESTLNLVEDALTALEAYQDALESADETMINDAASDMEMSYIALSGEANNYYE